MCVRQTCRICPIQRLLECLFLLHWKGYARQIEVYQQMYPRRRGCCEEESALEMGWDGIDPNLLVITVFASSSSSCFNLNCRIIECSATLSSVWTAEQLLLESRVVENRKTYLFHPRKWYKTSKRIIRCFQDGMHSLEYLFIRYFQITEHLFDQASLSANRERERTYRLARPTKR